jgi:hypothetical protein
MLLKQMSLGMAHQSEFEHVVSGTEPNAVDFSKRMIDITELDKHKESLFK